MTTSLPKKHRLALVDDDLLLVELLSSYLKNDDQFDIVLQASDGNSCLEQLGTMQDQHPEIYIIDLKMAGMDGLTLIDHIQDRYPDAHIVVVSSHYHNDTLGFMIKKGVAAFLPKGVSLKVLIEVLDEVMRRGFYLLPEQVDILRQQISHKVSPPRLGSELLTSREQDVLIRLAQQKTAKEIADELFITTRTVEGHKNNLFAKTGAKNLVGLVLYAIQQKIIDPDNINI